MSFRFMELPAELRLAVYAELLGNRGGLIILNSFGPPRPMRCSFEPAILRTCKTIYNEALPILYISNTFAVRAHRWEDLGMNYTVDMGVVNTALIRRVVCEAHGADVMEEGVMRAFKAMGLQWDDLHLFGIKLGNGLGGLFSPKLWREQEWLLEVKSRKEKQRLGLVEWGPLKETSWFVRKDGKDLPLDESVAV